MPTPPSFPPFPFKDAPAAAIAWFSEPQHHNFTPWLDIKGNEPKQWAGLEEVITDITGYATRRVRAYAVEAATKVLGDRPTRSHCNRKDFDQIGREMSSRLQQDMAVDLKQASKTWLVSACATLGPHVVCLWKREKQATGRKELNTQMKREHLKHEGSPSPPPKKRKLNTEPIDQHRLEDVQARTGPIDRHQLLRDVQLLVERLDGEREIVLLGVLAPVGTPNAPDPNGLRPQHLSFDQFCALVFDEDATREENALAWDVPGFPGMSSTTAIIDSQEDFEAAITRVTEALTFRMVPRSALGENRS